MRKVSSLLCVVVGFSVLVHTHDLLHHKIVLKCISNQTTLLQRIFLLVGFIQIDLILSLPHLPENSVRTLDIFYFF